MDTNNPRLFKAEIRELDQIRTYTENALTQQSADMDTIYDLSLAVYEAAANIIEHGYQGQIGMIEIEIKKENDSLYVYLRDQAPAFNPTAFPEPDISLPLEQRPVGGLGVYLIKHSVDEIRYRQLPKNGNELVLIKHNPS